VELQKYAELCTELAVLF